MDPGQINRLFKSIATRAELDPKDISGHSTRIGQIIAKVGWSKVDTVTRSVGFNNIEAINSPSTRQSELAVYSRPKTQSRFNSVSDTLA